MNIVQICPRIHTIFLHSDLKTSSWPLLEAIANLPHPEELTLDGDTFGPSVQLVLKTFNIPTLKRLKISSYGLGRDTIDPAGPREEPEPWPEGQKELEFLNELLPSDRHCMGSVETLELLNPCCQPRISEYILRLPACLVNLSIRELTSYKAAELYTTHAIQNLLDINCHTLKRIELGDLGNGSGTIPQFSGFPCLEEVRSCRCNVMGSPPDMVLRKLFAPALSCLILGFNTDDYFGGSPRDLVFEQMSKTLHEFCEGEVRWLGDFAKMKSS